MLFENYLNKLNLKDKGGFSLKVQHSNTGFISKIARSIYQPYKWFVFIPFLGVSTFILAIPALLLTFFVSPRIASLTAAVLWARLNSFVTPMLVTVEGEENIDKNQSYVVTSNHQSHFDIFVLYGWLGIDIKWVMKSSLRKVPVIGYVCEKMEHIYVDRSNTKAALTSINNAKKRIQSGTSVVFFPEGTRSETEKLGLFKKGAFKFAVDLDLPILPVTIMGTHKILPKNTLDLFPGKVRMIIHPPIETKHKRRRDLKDLMNETRKIINAPLQGI